MYKRIKSPHIKIDRRYKNLSIIHMIFVRAAAPFEFCVKNQTKPKQTELN